MARAQSANSHGGFTLVEVLSALLLLTTAAAGAALAVTTSLRAVREARLQTMAAALAVEKIEQLRSLVWTFDSGASASDFSTDLTGESSTAGGVGLRPSPTDTLSDDTAGYVDYVDATGTPVGDGSGPPAGALFVRRWSIRLLDEDPAHSLVLQAYVTTVSRARRPAGARPDQREAGDVLMATVLTRSGR